MSDQIRVNGNGYGWGSIVLKIGDERIYGITEISYGDKRERAKGYGAARHHAPILRSPGKYTTEPVVIKGYTHTIQNIRDMLAAQAPDEISYGNVESTIAVQYVEAGLGPQHHQIERCVISDDKQGMTEGPELGMAELQLDCMLIRRNGLTLFDSTQEVP